MANSPEQSAPQISHEEYQFVLKSCLHDGKLNVVVDFAPVRALLDRQRLCTFSILPQYNLDYRYYTSAFCTPYEGVYANKQLGRYKEKLKAALRNITASKILVPKPRQKPKRKCWVCLDPFDDYLEHIQRKQHIRKLSCNLYHKEIKKMAAVFASKQTRRTVTRSAKAHQGSSPAARDCNQAHHRDCNQAHHQ